MLIEMLMLAAAAADPTPIASGPNAEAPPGVARDYGRLVGSWSCKGSQKQPDGTWKENPGHSTWTFHYVLDGHAVQDVFVPAAGSPIGTNLRTYDPDADRWQMVWATETQARFDHFEARGIDGDIVMTGDRWAREAFQAHFSKITFHNIGEDHFDWTYEASSTGEEGPFSEILRISCDRA